ncbi:hypothetical protein HBI70_056260 [Parastagonospora nodorum]|nr:hypothetical protein HBH52_144620 [Parastagonospora nodorum]KAH4268441.1 hypothetical protein HBI03_059470 [Parastagonospora nodorum]KAH4279167.1 hypothetical protein HBI04_074920 [Parastagonospora nodorum]KAH4856571.1 hypothetical protein HBH75_077410 [Parastagonospora nodorum]KAH4987520.1 hypothetical protein HBI76_097090 [Parastagonospora nodorum]
MKLSDTVIVACVTLLPVALAADYSAGCSDKNMGESMCGGIGHRRLRRCYKGLWRNFQCPRGCTPIPFAQCSTYEFTWMVDPPVTLTVATNITLPANSTVATNITVPADLTVANNSTELPVH